MNNNNENSETLNCDYEIKRYINTMKEEKLDIKNHDNQIIVSEVIKEDKDLDELCKIKLLLGLIKMIHSKGGRKSTSKKTKRRKSISKKTKKRRSTK